MQSLLFDAKLLLHQAHLPHRTIQLLLFHGKLSIQPPYTSNSWIVQWRQMSVVQQQLAMKHQLDCAEQQDRQPAPNMQVRQL